MFFFVIFAILSSATINNKLNGALGSEKLKLRTKILKYYSY